MTEMYTTPFDSVQAAINLYEQKIDPTKSSTSTSKEEKGGFLKDLKDHNLQLDAKEHERNLAFFEFDASSKSPEELLALLKLCKEERDIYKEKFRKSQTLFLEYEKGKHFFHSISNLEADESRPAAQRKNKMIKREMSAREENGQQLFLHSSDIKKVILKSQLLNIETKKHSSAFSTGMEDLKVPEAEVFHSQVQLEALIRQLDAVEDLENELLKQMIISEYLHAELKQSKAAQTIFSKPVLSVMNELHLVKSENEQMKQANSESENHIHEIEEKGKRMDFQTEMLVGEIQKMQEEIFEDKNNPLEFQIENEEVGSNDFCTYITISVKEYEFLIHKLERADNTKSEPTKGYGVDKCKRELEDKNNKINELICRLEEAERRAELAEKGKLAVESQLKKWRDKLLLKRAASDAAKGCCAMENESNRLHEMLFLSKLGCIKPKPYAIRSHPKKSISMHDGKKIKA